MAKGRIFELAFRIGGEIARSFRGATGEASKTLTDLQRKSEALAKRQRLLGKVSQLGQLATGLNQTRMLLGAVLGQAVRVGQALYGVVGQTAALGDAAAKTAQNLGVDAEVLQELWYAAERSGGSQQDLTLALRKMTVGLGQAAAGGGEAAKWLQQLGLNAADLAALRPEKALGVLADALGTLPDAASRAVAAQAIFGEGAVKLGVLLDEGSGGLARLRAEARATGAVLARKTTQDAAAFQDRLLDLKRTFAGLRNTVGAALLPAFTALFQRLATWLQANRGRVQGLADRFGKLAEDALPRLARMLDMILAQDLPGLLTDAWVALRKFLEWAKSTWKTADGLAKSFGGWQVALPKIVKGLAALKALEIAGTLWDIAAAAVEATKEMKLLASIKSAGTTGLLIAIGLGLKDVHDYANGADSALGSFLSHYEGREDGFKGALAEQLREVLHFWGLISEADRKRMAALHAQVRIVDPNDPWVKVEETLAHITNRIADWKGLFLLLVSPAALVARALWAAFGEGLTAAVADLGRTLGGFFVAIYDEAVGVVEDFLGAVARAVQRAVGWMRSGIVELLALLPGTQGATQAMRARLAAEAAVAPELPRTTFRHRAQAPAQTLAESTARLSAAVRQERAGRSAGPLSVTYQPQITVQGDGTTAAGLQAALQQGQDDLLERLRAAQEQQQRLAYG